MGPRLNLYSRRSTVDNIQDELFDAGDVKGLLGFVMNLGRDPFYYSLPESFSETRVLQATELHDVLLRLEYRSRNENARIKTRLLFPGRGKWAYGHPTNLETNLDPNACMNVRAEDSWVLEVKLDYVIWPAILAIGIGCRRKPTGEVRALFGIADYNCQPWLCRNAVERDAPKWARK